MKVFRIVLVLSLVLAVSAPVFADLPEADMRDPYICNTCAKEKCIPNLGCGTGESQTTNATCDAGDAFQIPMVDSLGYFPYGTTADMPFVSGYTPYEISTGIFAATGTSTSVRRYAHCPVIINPCLCCTVATSGKTCPAPNEALSGTIAFEENTTLSFAVHLVNFSTDYEMSDLCGVGLADDPNSADDYAVPNGFLGISFYPAGVCFAETWSGQTLMSNKRGWLCTPSITTTPRLVSVPGVVLAGTTTTGWWAETNANLGAGMPTGAPAGLQTYAGSTNEADTVSDTVWRQQLFTSTAIQTSTCTGSCTTNTAGKYFRSSTMTMTKFDEVMHMSHMAIDIPAILVDSTINSCHRIGLVIEVFLGASGDICGDTAASCACCIQLYNVCCSDTSVSKTLVYPYFTSLLADNYWNGICIDNMGATDGTFTLTAYGADGSQVGTFSGSVPAMGMYVNLLESMSFTGAQAGQCWIKCVTTFNADGFAMLANDYHDSMGYLPRK